MFRLLLLLLLGGAGPVLAQTNRALVIAIGKYPTSKTGWGVIDSDNDVPLIQQVLTKQKFTDVKLLADKQANRDGILTAFRELIGRCQPGDNVLIHFSTHGQQIPDQNNDEPDGYDEAIVCYDAPKEMVGNYANYNGTLHLRDEDLGALIDELRRKLGADGDVLLLADACHSGTITRGGGLTKHRGGPPMRRPKAGNVPTPTTKVRGYQTFMYRKTPRQSGLAPYVAMSAANASELNYQCYGTDGKEVGSLSFAFNQAMQQIQVGESYRDLFDRMRSIMKQKVSAQTPQIEGDIDRQLFGGATVAQEAYLPVKSIGGTLTQLTLNAGQLEGLFDSTRVAVCDNLARDAQSGTVLARGVVVRTTPYTATVMLDQELPRAKNVADFRVFVTERTAGDLTVGIVLDSLRDPALRQRVQTELTRNRMVRFTGPPDLYLTANPAQNNALTFHRATDGSALDAEAVSATQLRGLSRQVQRYVQSQFLQRVTISGNPSVRFTASMVPLRPGKARLTAHTDKPDTLSLEAYRQGTLPGFTATDTALPNFRTGRDTVLLTITNTGTARLYYTVIDIMPNGEVAVILPSSDPENPDRPENYVVEPNQTVMPRRYVYFTPPYGKETFKIFATTEPVDLRRVVGQSRGMSATRGSLKKLEQFYDDTNDMAEKGFGTRGGGTGPLPDDTNLATFNFEFLILKK